MALVKRSGLTLLELMVVAALFAGALTCFVVLQIAVSRQSKQTTRETEVQDALAMTIEACKRDLRGARLVSWQANGLKYRLPVLDDQLRLIPGTTGEIQFSPTAPASYQIAMDSGDGWLKRQGPEGPRRMGRLGLGGLTCERVHPTRDDLLRLTFVCQLHELQRKGQLQVFFGNQL